MSVKLKIEMRALPNIFHNYLYLWREYGKDLFFMKEDVILALRDSKSHLRDPLILHVISDMRRSGYR